jgi:hypothetical protein
LLAQTLTAQLAVELAIVTAWTGGTVLFGCFATGAAEFVVLLARSATLTAPSFQFGFVDAHFAVRQPPFVTSTDGAEVFVGNDDTQPFDLGYVSAVGAEGTEFHPLALLATTQTT